MTATTTMKTDLLEVPGGKVYYEVRGAGPVLLMMPGGPADATTFRAIEDGLAKRYTVVTYDPRGLSHSSPFAEADDPRMVEIFADDCHRLLGRLAGGKKSSVFASSGGAAIALELVARHGDELDAVVFHEPPTPALSDDPPATRAAMEHVCDTCAAQGLFPAMQEFMQLVGVAGGPQQQQQGGQGEPSAEQQEQMAQMMRNFEFFFGRYIRNIARYEPDLDEVKSSGCRLICAYGAESTTQQLARNGAVRLAEIVGVDPVVFPGDHGGFAGRPAEFGRRLIEVLEG